MLWLINLVTPVKLTKEEEERGLDLSLHGEEAYIFDTQTDKVASI
jgi:ammonia channel protein AmtB